MKFYVIASKGKTKVLANVYEEPYSYSEYTQGGGYYNLQIESVDSIFYDEDSGLVSLAIFPTKEDAEKILNDREYLQRQGFEVCSILELED